LFFLLIILYFIKHPEEHLKKYPDSFGVTSAGLEKSATQVHLTRQERHPKGSIIIAQLPHKININS